MPRKPRTQLAALPTIVPQLLKSFGHGPMTAEAINAAFLALKKALIERARAGEMNHHLGYPAGAAKSAAVSNQRNGKGAKTMPTEDDPIRIEVPRDRDGSFAPLLIPKHERRFTGFDDKIVAMCARGMTVHEIQGFVLKQYATEVPPEFIRSVTDEVMAEVAAWQVRPLTTVFLDTTLQTYILHLIRNSLDYASWKDRKALAAAIRPIYTAVSAEAAQAELEAFADDPWGQKFPTVSAAWRKAWDRVIPFLAFPLAVRRVIYTTNAIENINSQLRKIIKTPGAFPQR